MIRGLETVFGYLKWRLSRRADERTLLEIKQRHFETGQAIETVADSFEKAALKQSLRAIEDEWDKCITKLVFNCRNRAYCWQLLQYARPGSSAEAAARKKIDHLVDWADPRTWKSRST